MTFKLTEEQKQQIQAGFDTLDCKELRKGPYDSWAGIELQLQEPKIQVRDDGTRFHYVFFMSKPDGPDVRSFSITKLTLEETEDDQTWVPTPIKINKVVLEDNNEV